MARARHAYPQVEPGALAGAVPVIPAPSPAVTVRQALRRCRDAGAAALVLGPGRAVRRADLERAMAWGLGRLRAHRLALRGVPVVAAQASEVSVRRRLAGGAPMVLIAAGRRPVGVVEAPPDLARPLHSVARELERLALEGGEPDVWLLRLCGKVAEGMGVRVHAVGGFVRDLLLGRRTGELDVVVEGDGPGFARRLAEELGARLTVHAPFGTASLVGGRGPDGARVGRVDVTTARREHYRAPGALPRVERAGIVEDLRRRDFSAHALAMPLAPEAFGQLLDPWGGHADLEARRLRLLSPLAFVEDPTRVFRAARYATRLGFRLDRDGRAALGLALAVGRYPALSGDRLRAEVGLVLDEPHPWRALAWLGRHGALGLWDPRVVAGPRLDRRLGVARRLATRARAAALGLDGLTLALVAVLGAERPPVQRACLARLAFTGQPGRALAAMARGPALARWLAAAPRPSLVVRRLLPLAEAALVAAWLAGGPGARTRLWWFWTAGRRARPALTGDDLLGLGVARGPAVGTLLATLRDGTLDGRLDGAAAERALVTAWLRRKGGNT